MMRLMPERSDEEIGELMRPGLLPPPPDAWVQRAEELPQLERALAEVDRRSNSNDDALRAALEHVGLQPDDERLRALRRLQQMHSTRR
jgi:hypothetical protein